jgi:hypothetical protein
MEDAQIHKRAQGETENLKTPGLTPGQIQTGQTYLEGLHRALNGTKNK